MGREKHISEKSQTVPPARRSPPRSIKRLIALFEHIAEHDHGMTLAELSASLDAPKSSLLTMLRPLADEEYLVHENSTYTLGPRVFQFATTILAKAHLPTMIRHHLKILSDQTGETAVFARLDKEQRSIFYEDVVEGNRSIRYVVPAGVLRPIYPTASGRVLLANTEEGWRNNYLASENFIKFTPLTITDPDELGTILDDVRERGICFTYGEAMEGAAGIAAPVFDGTSEIIGALLVGVPIERAEANRVEYEKKISDIARQLSVAMGYRP